MTTHVEPRYHPHRVKVGKLTETVGETIRTFDHARAQAADSKGAVTGEDVIPAHTRWTPQADGSLISEQVPERRIPWWEYGASAVVYTGPHECPDCGGGVAFGNDGTPVCQRLTPAGPDGDYRVKGAGGLVACGVEWIDVEDATGG